jgi:pilus assembly protein CpaF
MPAKSSYTATAFGLLQALMEDPAVTKIMVDAPDRVLVQREGNIEKTGITFDSEATLRTFINEVLASGGAAFQGGKTVCEVRLVDNSSVVAILPPTAATGPCLVIHKAFKDTMTVQRLIEYGSVSAEMMALLRSAIRNRLNILVTGDADAGKMTIVNVLTGEIPEDERVIVVEGVPELQTRARWQVCLNSEAAGGLTFTDLINTATKMRPDRLVFGEIKGPEAMRILQVMSSGYDGCLVPIHATSAEDALNRLEAYCLMSNLGLGLEEIRILIASSLNLITVQHKLPNGKRKITEVVELRGLDKDRYILQPLMRYNPETDQFETMPVKPEWDTTI